MDDGIQSDEEQEPQQQHGHFLGDNLEGDIGKEDGGGATRRNRDQSLIRGSDLPLPEEKPGGDRLLPPPWTGDVPPPPLPTRSTCYELGRRGSVKKMADPEARREDAKFLFSFVYQDGSGRTIVRPVGETFSCGDGRHLDDLRSLEQLGFQIGYSLDVAIQ